MIRVFIFFILSIIALPEDQHQIMSSPENSTSQDPVVSFGLIADVQYSKSESLGTRYFSESANKLREAINDFNDQNLDFVISMGDLINDEFSSYDTIIPILKSSAHPVNYLLGNHEYNVKTGERKRVMKQLGMEKAYYSFTIGTFRFIVLDSNDISIYSPNLRKRKEASRILELLASENKQWAHDYNGAIGGEQMNWLKSQLDESVGLGQRVIILSHHPVYPESSYNILNWKEVIEVISGYNNIKAWLCGHMHEGGYGNFNLIHFVNFRGMVETEDRNSYAVVELYDNKIWIKGRGREKSMILAY